MPDPVAVNDILRIKTFCFQPPQVGINIRFAIVTSVVGVINTADVAAVYDGLVQGPYKALLSNPSTYVGVNCQRIFPGTPTFPAGTQVSAGVGTAGATALPAQVSGIITTQTGLAGRKFRGRSYIPFPATADSTGTPPVPTGKAICQSCGSISWL